MKEFVSLSVIAETDAALPRLNNSGVETDLPAGHGATSPLTIKTLALHYVELVPTDTTGYKEGSIIYKSPETFAGGSLAIAHDSLVLTTPGEVSISFNQRKIPPGTYNHVRVAIAYIIYEIPLQVNDLPGVGTLENQTATMASVLGFSMFANTLQIQNLQKEINANCERGYWLLETNLSDGHEDLNTIYTWQINETQITTPNILSGISPTPSNQGIMTGTFSEPLVIDDEDSRDVTLKLRFSTNQMFEWEDDNGNGFWDFNASDIYSSEVLVDFGLRGLFPTFSYSED